MNFRIGWGDSPRPPYSVMYPFLTGPFDHSPLLAFIPGGGDNSQGDEYASRSLASI